LRVKNLTKSIKPSKLMPKSYRNKVCSICGKSEGMHWARHWKNQHPTAAIKELVPGDVPLNPFDESWLYLIKPLSIRELYMTPAKIEEVPPIEVIDSNYKAPAMLNSDP